jgi:uncharacterized protein with FMN-binding domain
METYQRQKLIGIILALFVAGGVGVISFIGERAPGAASLAQATPSAVVPAVPAQSPASAPAVSVPPPATVPKKTASVYKDGTYTATGSYMSPGGEDQITVTLTLANDVITAVSVTPAAGDWTSQRYQSYFASGYKQYVVGQNIDNVNLTYVSGPSLTPAGFDDAISQIKAQAKA